VPRPPDRGALETARRLPRPIACGEAAMCHYVLMPQLPPDPDEPPPFLGTWRRVYMAILIYLGAIIAGFYLFTRAYR